MSLFVERPVFNRDILGKPCKLVGYSHDGEKFDCYALIHSVGADEISMILYNSMKLTFTIEDFDHGEDSLDIIILEVEDVD